MQIGSTQVVQQQSPAEPMQTAALAMPEPAHPGVAKPLELSGIALTSSLSDRPDAPRSLAAPTRAPQVTAMVDRIPDALPNAERLDSECPVTLKAENSIAALVNLKFSSKCDPYTRVTFTHEGLVFSELTDSTGSIEIAVPALVENARFTADLPVGDAAVALVTVESVVFYDRAVLQGIGQTGMTLHALEFGAGYDADGHVWVDTPRDPTIAARGEGGFMMTLGDPTLPESTIAQVYTFPSGTARNGGKVRLSVEAEVLAETCERDVSAQVFQISSGARINSQELTIAMPTCDAVGDYLLLNTPLNDLKIASR
ncbi:translocase [Pseudooceanicola sp.]|uniref:translocase n=1 Tax=Pseudooceanicola sp. TaxID=1914328 RepID=UPI002617A4C1|nr:translocase [Pseudooceanicola sp.]